MSGIQGALERFLPVTLLLWGLAGAWFGLRLEERAMREDLARPYRAALAGMREPYERNYAIVVNGKRAGKALAAALPRKDGSFDLAARVEGRIYWMGSRLDVRFFSSMHITAAYELEALRMSLEAGGAKYEISGYARREGAGGKKEIALTLSVGGEKVRSFTVPTESLALSDSLMPLMKMGRPKPGKKWTTDIVEPLTGRVRTLEFRVLDEEELPDSKGKLRGYPVEMKSGDRVYTAWVDEEGDVLMEEVPLGFTLVREDVATLIYGPEEARREDRNGREDKD